VDSLAEQLDDLKTAVLSTIGDSSSREIARGAVNFRFLIDCVLELGIPDLRNSIETGVDWDQLMDTAGIYWDLNILVPAKDHQSIHSRRVLLSKSDGTYLEGRIPPERVLRLPEEWSAYMRLPPTGRTAIFDALQEIGEHRMRRFRPIEADKVAALVEDEELLGS
jgi:hypothetical protein